MTRAMSSNELKPSDVNAVAVVSDQPMRLRAERKETVAAAMVNCNMNKIKVLEQAFMSVLDLQYDPLHFHVTMDDSSSLVYSLIAIACCNSY